MPNRLTRARLLRAGRIRRRDRLKQLRAEIIAIERTFPELALTKRRRALRKSIARAESRARTMSAAARKAVSARMKRHWAQRRQAKARLK
jgi:hypothetical protein